MPNLWRASAVLLVMLVIVTNRGLAIPCQDWGVSLAEPIPVEGLRGEILESDGETIVVARELSSSRFVLDVYTYEGFAEVVHRGNVEVPSKANDVLLAAPRAYVACRDFSVLTIDLGDIRLPVVADRLETDFEPKALTMLEGDLIAAGPASPQRDGIDVVCRYGIEGDLDLVEIGRDETANIYINKIAGVGEYLVCAGYGLYAFVWDSTMSLVQTDASFANTYDGPITSAQLKTDGRLVYGVTQFYVLGYYAVFGASRLYSLSLDESGRFEQAAARDMKPVSDVAADGDAFYVVGRGGTAVYDRQDLAMRATVNAAGLRCQSIDGTVLISGPESSYMLPTAHWSPVLPEFYYANALDFEIDVYLEGQSWGATRFGNVVDVTYYTHSHSGSGGGTDYYRTRHTFYDASDPAHLNLFLEGHTTSTTESGHDWVIVRNHNLSLLGEKDGLVLLAERRSNHYGWDWETSVTFMTIDMETGRTVRSLATEHPSAVVGDYIWENTGSQLRRSLAYSRSEEASPTDVYPLAVDGVLSGPDNSLLLSTSAAGIEAFAFAADGSLEAASLYTETPTNSNDKVKWSGRYLAYGPYNGTEVHIIDYADPAEPRLVGTRRLLSRLSYLDFRDGVLMCSGWDGGESHLQVMSVDSSGQVRDLVQPIVLRAVVLNAVATDRVLYVATGKGQLKAFDITTGGVARRIGTAMSAPGTLGLYDDYLMAGPLVYRRDCSDALEPVDVDIEVLPGSEIARLKCVAHRGIVPVAILTGGGIDALSIDHSSVRFGPNGASEAHANKHGMVRHEEDIDADGDLDLVFHFRSEEIGIRCGDTKVSLEGVTFDGRPVKGAAAIVTDWGADKAAARVWDVTISPNPFNPSTRMMLTLEASRHVRVAIYDLRGRLVVELVDGPYTPGKHELTWTGRDSAGRSVPSGEYLFRVESGERVETVKALLLR